MITNCVLLSFHLNTKKAGSLYYKGVACAGRITQWYSTCPVCKFWAQFQALHLGMEMMWGGERK